MYALCVSGAVNMPVFAWKLVYAYIYIYMQISDIIWEIVS